MISVGNVMTVARGSLVIVSSPSGAGKTTLTRRLLAEYATVTFSVSYTTRPRRVGEVDGRDYHFVDSQQFLAMVNASEFAEHALVHGNHYGTAKAPIEAALQRGQDVIFDVDWQGGASLSTLWPQDSLKIFILPPDLETLEFRLRNRATDAPEVIERRLRKAIEELAHYSEYEHLIVNADLERAYAALEAIYLVRRYREVGEPEFATATNSPRTLAYFHSIVDENLASQPDVHARRLIAQSH